MAVVLHDGIAIAIVQSASFGTSRIAIVNRIFVDLASSQFVLRGQPATPRAGACICRVSVAPSPRPRIPSWVGPTPARRELEKS